MKTCPHCRKRFAPKEWWNGRAWVIGKTRFCSTKCRSQKWQAKNRKRRRVYRREWQRRNPGARKKWAAKNYATIKRFPSRRARREDWRKYATSPAVKKAYRERHRESLRRKSRDYMRLTVYRKSKELLPLYEAIYTLKKVAAKAANPNTR